MTGQIVMAVTRTAIVIHELITSLTTFTGNDTILDATVDIPLPSCVCVCVCVCAGETGCSLLMLLLLLLLLLLLSVKDD